MKASLVLVALFCLAPTSPLHGSEQEVVAATARLNLRACPSTVDCPARRTLAIETRLEVLSHDGVWFRVRVVDDGEVGWVSSAYTKSAEVAGRSQKSGLSEVIDFLPAWYPVLFGLGAIILVSFALSFFESDRSVQQIALLLTGAFLVGAVFLLNQLGAFLNAPSRSICPYQWTQLYLGDESTSRVADWLR